MKIKKWLAMAGMAALLGGGLLMGLPAAKSFAAGVPPAGIQAGQNGPGMGMGIGRANGGMSGATAQLLGISQSDLIAARQSGKSLVQIASEKGISEQKLIESITAQRSAQIDQLVKDGKMTQDQASLCKQQMTERIKANINRTSVGPIRTGTAGQGQGKAFKAGAGQGQGMGMAGRGAGRGTGPRATNGSCPYYPAQNQ